MPQLALHRNERSYPFSPEEMALLTRGVDSACLTDYPSLDRFYDCLGFSRDQTLATHGGEAALRLCFEGFVRPGDAIVHLRPTYHRIVELVNLFGASAVVVDHRPDLSVDVASLRAAVRKGAKLAIVTNPNVSGSALTLDVLASILDDARRAPCYVVVDEAYVPPGSWEAPSLINAFDNLVVLATFSKFGGLAGVRAGFVAAAPKIIEILRPYGLKPGLSGPAAQIAANLMRHPEILSGHVARLQEGRETLKRILEPAGILLLPGSANFVVLCFREHSAESVAARLLNESNIKLVPYRPPFASFLRVTLGSVDQMEIVARAVAKVVGCR